MNSNEYSKIEIFEKTLDNLDLVSDFFVLRFDNRKLFYRIIYNGSPVNFLDDMKKVNFNFFTENNVWSLK